MAKKPIIRKIKSTVERPIKITLEIIVKTDNILNNNVTKSSSIELMELSIADQLSIDVKTIILAIVGNGKIKPKDLPEDYNLEEDLGYNDELKDFLHAALNNYVDHKKSGVTISQKEMDDCETVGDCVTLVNKKIS
jgi:hypothetical protein